MPTTLSRRREDRCDHHDDRCPCADCRAWADELRAARRDAVLHALATVRPRRPVR